MIYTSRYSTSWSRTCIKSESSREKKAASVHLRRDNISNDSTASTSTAIPPISLRYDAIIEPAPRRRSGPALRTAEFHLGQVKKNEMPGKAHHQVPISNHQKQSMAGVQVIEGIRYPSTNAHRWLVLRLYRLNLIWIIPARRTSAAS